MAGTIPKVIDDALLSCQLCMKSLSRPKLLPCMHSFCEECLKKYVQTLSKDKRNTELLDIKVVEDALKGGLDREIPIHGYDDVVGNYPSLPRHSMLKCGKENRWLEGEDADKIDLDTEIVLPGNKGTEKGKGDHEYSEIPPISLTDPKHKRIPPPVPQHSPKLPPPMVTKQQLPANSKPQQVATGLKKIKNKLTGSQNIQNKKQSQNKNKVGKATEDKGFKSEATKDGLEKVSSVSEYTLAKSPTSPSYIPMDKPQRSRSDPIDEQFNVDTFQDHGNSDDKPKSESARTSKVISESSYTSFDKSNENTQGGDSYVAMDSVDEGESLGNPTSPGAAYETMNTSTEAEEEYLLQNNSDTNKSPPLAGFGLASPVSMALYQNRQKMNNFSVESVYQLEKPGKKQQKRLKISKFKLSKRTSKSVDVLSPLSSQNTVKFTDQNYGDTTDEKQSSTTDISNVREEQSIAVEHHLKHSISTPYMAQPGVALHNDSLDSEPNQTLLQHSMSFSENLMSTTSYTDLDGYETPINKRKPVLQTPITIDTGSLDDTSVSLNQMKNDEIPVLPPKRLTTTDKLSPGIPHHEVDPPVLRHSPGNKRRDAVGETIIFTSPTESSHGEISRDSVFDHIYEEIEQNKATSGGKQNSVKKSSVGVPMFTAISSSHNQKVTSQGKPTKVGPDDSKSSVSPRTKKVQKLLKKSQHLSAKKVPDLPLVGGGLQLGNKLARKSQALVDDTGFAYISDQFEKVHVHHNNEDIELIYSEVCDIQNTIPPTFNSGCQTETYGTSDKLEYMCPTCSALFRLPELTSVDSLPTFSFLENLKDTRRLENNSKPACKQCSTKAEFKCLECDYYLCKKCNDSHNWYKVVRNHQVMTLTQLQSGMYTNQIMSSQQQDECPNHNGETPQYYCDTCNVAVCKECSHCYHNGHKCQLIADIAKRGTAYLENFENTTGHISHRFQAENLQIDKYKLQYNNEKQKAVSNITKQYAKAQTLLGEAYNELLRHIDVRFSEEATYLEQLQKRNAQFLQRIEQTNKLAEQVTQFGSQCDVVTVAKAVAKNLLEMEKCEPLRLEHKMEVNFSPLASVRPIDVLPMIGQASREYKPIKRREPLESPIQNVARYSRDPVKPMHTFTPKTPTDTKGCKPTGIALTKEDNIVLVDDINKKIKIFKEDGNLVREIVPQTRHELVDPWDVTVTNYGNFAVTDRGSKQVKIFDPDGDLVCNFGPHLANPWGINCNKDGDLLVTDTEHKCVFVHDSNGNLKYRIDPPIKMAKFPEYITTNSYNDVIVSDLKAHCIYVFNLLGQFLFKIGPKEQYNSKLQLLHSPCGIYCDQNDNILVADYEMMRVSKFDKNGKFVSHFLTFLDNLRAPQSLIVNKKDHVILSDGNFIKTFNPEGMNSDDADNGAIDLELKPKVYNIRQTRRQLNQQHKGYASDGEDETTELQRNEPVRRTVGGPSHHRPQQPIKKPVTGRQSRVSTYDKPNARSSSVPPRNLRTNDPHSAVKSLVNYDTPRVSVQKIKQKLSSLERGNTPPSDREPTPDKNGKQPPSSPLWKNYETAQVSVGKVKEQLINQTKQQPGVKPVKPQLRPKPSFKKDLSTPITKPEGSKEKLSPPVRNNNGRKSPTNLSPVGRKSPLNTSTTRGKKTLSNVPSTGCKSPLTSRSSPSSNYPQKSPRRPPAKDKSPSPGTTPTKTVARSNKSSPPSTINKSNSVKNNKLKSPLNTRKQDSELSTNVSSEPSKSPVIVEETVDSDAWQEDC